MPRCTGKPALTESTYRRVNALAVGDLVEAAAAAGVRRVVHCSTVGVHGDIQHPPADEDAPLRPGDVYQATKLEGERLAREAAARTGIELTIARPSGIYGPGDRRLLKLFRGVARRRFVILGDGRIFYHLTYIDDLVEGFRLCGEVPAAAGRTYILAGGDVTTLNELVGLIAEGAGVPPPRVHLPVWPFWVVGAACEAICRPLRHRTAHLPAPRGLLHQEPRVPDRSRASRAGLRARCRSAGRHSADAGVVQGAGMDIDQRSGVGDQRSGVGDQRTGIGDRRSPGSVGQSGTTGAEWDGAFA